MKPFITNIQRFCVHDGPGIRTTVFFKGCSLHCPWCANPENINFEQQVFVMKEKCQKSCKRIFRCSFYLDGYIEKNDISNCVYGVFDLIGKQYSEEELYREIMKDVPYYQKDGGVTFSGGEALLFLEQYESMIVKLHEDGINICVETALFVPFNKISWAVKYIDYFYVDIKVLNQEQCKSILGGDLNLFLQNIKYLHEHIEQEKIIYRIPLVSQITYTEENLTKIIELVSKYPPKQIEIFSVHNLGAKKYERLGETVVLFDTISMEILKNIKKELSTIGINIVINLL